MTDQWVTVARLIKGRGIKGELVAELHTSSIERLRELRDAHLFAPAAAEPNRAVQVENAWLHGDRVILKFSGIDSLTDAEPLAGMELRVPLSQRPAPPEGEYYQSDLIGCAVVERNGAVVGEVTGIENSGGPDLLAVKCGSDELLIPFVKAICFDVSIEARRIMVDLPEGLKEL